MGPWRNKYMLLKRTRALAALLGLFSPIAGAQPTPPPEAALLLRDEVREAGRKIHWKGPELSDETLLAIAASGLSWEPASAGIPLIVRDKSGAAYAPDTQRNSAFQQARAAGRHKIAVPFALSLVLDPGALNYSVWRAAYEYLDQFGSDFDSMLVGVL